MMMSSLTDQELSLTDAARQKMGELFDDIDAGVAGDAMLWGEVRGRRLPARQAALPFVPHRYKR